MAKPVNSELQLRLQQRRRAVYAALSEVFSERTSLINLLFVLWEREFAAQPHFLVVRYVSRCADVAGLTDGDRMQLIRRTFEMLVRSYDSLPPYPESALAAIADMPVGTIASATGQAEAGVRATSPPTVAPPPPSSESLSVRSRQSEPAELITAAVARSIMAPVRAQFRSQPATIRDMLSDAFKHTRLMEREQLRLLTWAAEGASDALTLSGYPEEQLKQLIHALYLCACDALGPVAADRLLSQSINRAQALPAAMEFPPDNLL